MWFFSRQTGLQEQVPNRPVLIEGLEDRTLMSAVAHQTIAHIAKPAVIHHAIVVKATAEQKQIAAEQKQAAAAPKAAKQAAAAAAKAPRQAAVAEAKAEKQAAMTAKQASQFATTTAKKSAQAAGVAPQSQVQSYITSAAPSVVGQWVGTMTPDGSTVSSTFSVNFAFQRGVAASGTFNFGAILGNQSAVSTMVFSQHQNVRVLVSTSNLLVGMTGTLTSDNATLYGRYSFNSPAGWQTGMFILTR